VLRQQNTQTKRYENRCSEKTQKKNYMRTDDPIKKPAKTVQTFSKKTGTPNKNISSTLC
jgi:hypothetical protein